MADPAASGARNAGNPNDEEDRPDIEAIEARLALVPDGATWDARSVNAAKADLHALCAEVRRLRSLAGIIQ